MALKERASYKHEKYYYISLKITKFILRYLFNTYVCSHTFCRSNFVFIIVTQLSIQSLFTFSFRHTRFYHQCRYHSLYCLDVIGSVNMQSMYVCLVLNVPQRKLGSLKNYKNSLEAAQY